jgi:hypothetical protein
MRQRGIVALGGQHRWPTALGRGRPAQWRLAVLEFAECDGATALTNRLPSRIAAPPAQRRGSPTDRTGSQSRIPGLLA